MKTAIRNSEVSLERAERNLLIAAQLVVAYGPKLAKVLQRCQEEVDLLRANDPVAKAKAILAAHNRPGAL